MGLWEEISPMIALSLIYGLGLLISIAFFGTIIVLGLFIPIMVWKWLWRLIFQKDKK